MDYKKYKADLTAVPRRIRDFSEPTGNIYETIVVLSKRANQIAAELKEELNHKIQDYTASQDNLEEVFENREQIEIARFYEKMPKPSLLSVHEFLKGKVYYRNPAKDTSSVKENN